MTNVESLLNQLEERREELDLSKEKMARKLDVSITTYMNWTAGRTKPGGDNVIKIMEELELIEGGQND